MSTINSYYENYYSAEEKRANVISSVTKALVEAGASITESDIGNATKEQFRAVYEELVKTKGVADPLAVTMLKVSGAFASVAVEVDTLTESLSSTLESLVSYESMIVSQTDKLNEEALTAAENAYDALVLSINKEKELKKSAYDQAVTDINLALDAQVKAYDIQIQAANSLVSEVESVANAIKGTIESIVDDSYMASAKRFNDSLNLIASAASTGDIFAEGLTNALSTVQGDNKRFFGSSFDYNKFQALLRNDLSSLGVTAGAKLTDAQQMVKVLEDSKLSAQNLAKDQIQVLTDTYNLEIKNLDGLATTAKDQLDQLKGIYTSVSSLASAMLSFSSAIQGANAIKGGTSTRAIQAGIATATEAINTGVVIPTDTLTNLNKNKATDKVQQVTPTDLTYVSSLGAGATYDQTVGTGNFVSGTGKAMSLDEAAGIMRDITAQSAAGTVSAQDIITTAKKEGLSKLALLDLFNYSNNGSATEEDMNAWLLANGIPAYASGGSYRGGLALAGENGPELINFSQPGMIYNAGQTSELLNSGSTEVVSELQALREELTMLRAESRATAINTNKMTRQLERASGENDVLKVQVV